MDRRTHPKLYGVWRNAIYRCFNIKSKFYKDYGGRGITVCFEWLSSFDSFVSFALGAGWRPGLSIDRIDNNGNYEPSNCRFVTPAENNRNQRPRKRKYDLPLGIYYHENSKVSPYRAAICLKGRVYHVGCFKTCDLALEALNKAKEEYLLKGVNTP